MSADQDRSIISEPTQGSGKSTLVELSLKAVTFCFQQSFWRPARRIR